MCTLGKMLGQYISNAYKHSVREEVGRKQKIDREKRCWCCCCCHRRRRRRRWLRRCRCRWRCDQLYIRNDCDKKLLFASFLPNRPLCYLNSFFRLFFLVFICSNVFYCVSNFHLFAFLFSVTSTFKHVKLMNGRLSWDSRWAVLC